MESSVVKAFAAPTCEIQAQGHTPGTLVLRRLRQLRGHQISQTAKLWVQGKTVKKYGGLSHANKTGGINSPLVSQ